MEMFPILTGEQTIVFKNLGSRVGVSACGTAKNQVVGYDYGHSNVDQTARQ
jgi:hypothetical protein